MAKENNTHNTRDQSSEQEILDLSTEMTDRERQRQTETDKGGESVSSPSLLQLPPGPHYSGLPPCDGITQPPVVETEGGGDREGLKWLALSHIIHPLTCTIM